jgi:hypothetical protein
MSETPKNAEQVLAAWADLRVSLEELDRDITKNLTKGNVAAGRRARAGFRALKKAVTDIMKDMVALEKVSAQSDTEEKA